MLRAPLVFAAFAAAFALSSAGLFAAPLIYGFYQAPPAGASAAQRAEAFLQARERLLLAARGYAGTPYLLGGTTRRGMDCSGFVYRSFRSALGVSPPRTSESMFLWTERIAAGELQPGDLVFFRTTGTARITHVGIYTGDGFFIHSASQGRATGVIFSRLDEPYWAGVYAGAGRALPGICHAEITGGAAAEEEGAGSRRFFFRRRAEGQNETGLALLGLSVAPTWRRG